MSRLEMGAAAASTTSRTKAVPKAQLQCVVVDALVVTALSRVKSVSEWWGVVMMVCRDGETVWLAWGKDREDGCQ